MPNTIAAAAAALRQGSVSSVELVTEAIAQADRHDGELRVFSSRFEETALAAAAAADRDFAAGRDRGALQGIPLGIKDNILTEEGPTGGASLVENPRWQERRDAPVVAMLRDAGGIVMGKTTMLELAVGVPEESRPLTTGRNPWSVRHWAGGSSTGSAAGVASGMFLGALGTDTGGSVRLPAAFCGITGFKPTFGLVSRTDVIPLAFSLDAVGPMTRDAGDAALMLGAIAGHDAADPASQKVEVPDYLAALGGSIEGLRIGVDRANHLIGEHVDPSLVARFEEAVAELRGLGATVTEIELPHFQATTDAVMITVFGEGQAYHQPELREQWDAYGPPTRLAFAGGSLVSAADYVAAQQLRRIVRRQVEEIYRDVDLIVHPSTARAALAFDGFNLEELVRIVYAHYWNAVGFPALTTPMGFDDDGLPFGLQIVAPPFQESLVLGAADAFQRATGWHLRDATAPADGAPEGDEQNVR